MLWRLWDIYYIDGVLRVINSWCDQFIIADVNGKTYTKQSHKQNKQIYMPTCLDQVYIQYELKIFDLIGLLFLYGYKELQ